MPLSEARASVRSVLLPKLPVISFEIVHGFDPPVWKVAFQPLRNLHGNNDRRTVGVPPLAGGCDGQEQEEYRYGEHSHSGSAPHTSLARFAATALLVIPLSLSKLIK